MYLIKDNSSTNLAAKNMKITNSEKSDFTKQRINKLNVRQNPFNSTLDRI